MSYRLIYFLLCYLIFGGIAGFTLYMFFTKFGGFGSIPDKLPDVPTTVPSIPTQTPNAPSLDDIKNNKWVYGGVGIGSVLIFSLMTVCGFFWCLCHSPDSRQSNEVIRLQPIIHRVNQPTVQNQENNIKGENSLEELLVKARVKLDTGQQNWLKILLKLQEEKNKGRNDDFVNQELQKAKSILIKSERLNSEELEAILQAKSKLTQLEWQKRETQIEVLPFASSSSKLLSENL